MRFKHRTWLLIGSAASMASLPLGGSSVTAEKQTGPFNPLTSFNLLVSLAVGRTRGPVINASLGKGQRSEAQSLIIIILSYSSFRATFSPLLREGPVSIFQDTGGWWPNPALHTAFPFLPTPLTASPWPKRLIVGRNSQRGPRRKKPQVCTQHTHTYPAQQKASLLPRTHSQSYGRAVQGKAFGIRQDRGSMSF